MPVQFDKSPVFFALRYYLRMILKGYKIKQFSGIGHSVIRGLDTADQWSSVSSINLAA